MAKKVHKGAHKYRRTKLSPSTDTVIYRCVLPDCSHYILPHLLKGKKSICWRCRPEHEFVIEREHQNMAKPHCSHSINRIGSKNKVAISDVEVEDLLNSLDTFKVD